MEEEFIEVVADDEIVANEVESEVEQYDSNESK